jgi:hypothetical protein
MADRRVYGDVDAPGATVHTVRLQNGSYVDVAFRWNNTLEPPPILTPVIIACVVVAITPLVAVAVCACLRRRRASPGASAGSQKSGLAQGSEADAAKQRLLQAKKAAQSLRLTVSGSMYATGWFFIILTLMGVVLKVIGIWPDPRILVDLNGTDPNACCRGETEIISEVWHIPYTSAFCLMPLGPPCMLLAVLPSDRRAQIAFASIFAVFDVIFWFILVFLAIVSSPPVDQMTTSDIVSAASLAGGALTLTVNFGLLVPTLICDCECACMCRMTARAALARLWLCLRIFLILFGVLMGTLGVQLGIRDNTEAYWKVVAPCIVAIPIFFGLALGLTPSVRRRVHRRLGDLTLRGEARSAAAIAALVGGRDANEALTHATRSFRGLPYAELSDTDLMSNSDAKGLYARTTSTTLGAVHAFLSHSWHDSASAKWQVLAEWADAQPAPPMLWLDKACIDQQRINESLAALPVYLSGCKELLVLVGPTYCGRLWCVIELFTWLQMGGAAERVRVSPLPPEEGAAVGVSLDTQLATFDALQAQCYKADERQRLLGIIEEAFGDFKVFNAAVRSILTQRSQVVAVEKVVQQV